MADNVEPIDAEAAEWMNASLGPYPESTTPALDAVMDIQSQDGDVSREVYLAAALEAYDLMGMALSEAGSMYLLMGSMLGEIAPSGSEDNAGSE